MMNVVFLYSIFIVVAFIGLTPVANASEVPIKRTKDTTVTIDTNVTVPGQSYKITIYKPERLPYGTPLQLGYIPAKDSPILYENGTKPWVAWSDSGTWNTTKTSLTISTFFNEWKYGLYKLVVLANGTVIGVSKPIQIKHPNIHVPLSKRTYSQWESIHTLMNPYPTLFLQQKRFYSYEIFPKSIPDSYYSSDEYLQKQYDYPSDLEFKLQQFVSTRVVFSPGLYNIRIVVRSTYYNRQWMFYPKKVDYVTSIRNTTFKVLQNNAQISIANNQTNFKFGDMVNLSFTTTNKVPLNGPIYISKSLPNYSATTTVQQDTASSENITTINNSDTLYGSFLIEKDTFGCLWKAEPIQIGTNEIRYANPDFQNAYAPNITIDGTTRPKDRCTSGGISDSW